jgi:hypothetical protein
MDLKREKRFVLGLTRTQCSGDINFCLPKLSSHITRTVHHRTACGRQEAALICLALLIRILIPRSATRKALSRSNEIERDRTREWWKAEWNSQLQWWFWVIDSGPAGVNEGQHLAALECHRQKADDGLGWRKD